MISIGALEKSVNRLAEKLRAEGWNVDVYTFRSGGVKWYGASYVEMYCERDGIRKQFKYLANGRDAAWATELSGTWSEMKKATLTKLEKTTQ